MNKYYLYLRILVTLGGCLLTSAAIPVFFPPSLMATVHRMLGLGEFPEQPIVVYLAKSTSLLYAVHGIVMLYVAATFDRNKHLVPLLGWLHVVLGAVLLYIDCVAPMPWWWLSSEGPPVMAFGLLFLWLYRRARRGSAPA